MGYIQFLQMIPEATLMAILVILFFVDFFSTPSGARAQGESGAVCRSWMNPLAGVLILAQTLICLFFSQPVTLFGGMYVATSAVAVMKTILTAGTLVVVVQSRLWMSREDTMNKEGEFYMLLVSTLLGMYVMMSAGHFLMFFLGLEMASVPMACLVALDKYRHHSAEAAAKYILTATFSSGVMLYGLSMLYAATGKLSFTMLASALSLHHHPALVVLGLVFFLSGLAFKLSLVPFHFWTADTYQGAPTTVTGYLSVISKGAAAFILAVLLVKVFPAFSDQWLMWLYILIVLSITVGNLFAIRQSDLKRFMAFSSISQAGYIVLAIVGGAANLPESQALSMTALSYYVLVYVAANLAVFAVISVVEEKNGGRTDIDAYNGFYQTNPKLSLLMTLALFSLAGIPPFAGMFSKFFVFMAAAREGSFGAYLVVFIALVNTVVSLYYYLLIVKAMYIKNSDAPLPTFRSDNGTRLALFLCTAGILLFGIFSCFYQWIFAAAEF